MMLEILINTICFSILKKLKVKPKGY